MTTIRKMLLAMPIMFSLSACSCGNKITTSNPTNFDEISAAAVVTDVTETPTFFGGKVSDRVFFATDKSALNHEAREILATQAEILKGKDNLQVVVEGHCDERGTREYNLALGERRADAAKKFLCNSGVNCDSISTVSYGKERPEIQGHDVEAWAQNRRAVTVVEQK